MASGILNFDSMFSGMNKIPWHGQGNVVEGLLTAKEAIEAAGITWRVDKVPAYFQTDDGNYIEIPNQFITRRSDLKDKDAILGNVGSYYEILQNEDAFSFCDALVEDSGAHYETAGSLWNGKRVWMLLKFPDDVRIEGTDDITNQYLCLTNGHDGLWTLKVMITPIRVVCQNTLNMAIGTAKTEISIRHTASMMGKIKQAQTLLGLTKDYYIKFGETMNYLNTIAMTNSNMTTYLSKIYPIDKEKDNIKGQNKKLRYRAKALELFESSDTCNLPGIQGTAYSALQAVIEAEDHRKLQGEDNKNEKSKSDAFLNRIWFQKPPFKQNAMQVLMEVVNA